MTIYIGFSAWNEIALARATLASNKVIPGSSAHSNFQMDPNGGPERDRRITCPKYILCIPKTHLAETTLTLANKTKGDKIVKDSKEMVVAKKRIKISKHYQYSKLMQVAVSFAICVVQKLRKHVELTAKGINKIKLSSNMFTTVMFSKTPQVDIPISVTAPQTSSQNRVFIQNPLKGLEPRWRLSSSGLFNGLPYDIIMWESKKYQHSTQTVAHLRIIVLNLFIACFMSYHFAWNLMATTTHRSPQQGLL